MYAVRYTINNSDKVNIGFVDTDNSETAQRLVFNRLKADNHKSIIIHKVEKTFLNGFLNPEIRFLSNNSASLPSISIIDSSESESESFEFI